MSVFKFLLRWFAILAGVCVLGAWYFVTVPVWTSPVSRLDRADANALKQVVVDISDGIGARHHNRPDKLNEVADYIHAKFSAFGDARFQEYEAGGTIYKNVLLRLKGDRHCENGIYVVGAHYDTHLQNPGADDNTSGVAGIIELARLIHEGEMPCDVELAAYSLEEPPNFQTSNMGSFHHARSLENHPNVTMIALEMIGYFSDEPESQQYPVSIMKYVYGDRGDFIGVVGSLENRATIKKLKRSFVKSNKIKTLAISAPESVPGVYFSDHQNYMKLGFDAVMITDTAFYRNKNYHRMSDTYETLDFERMAAVVDSTYYALKDLMADRAEVN